MATIGIDLGTTHSAVAYFGRDVVLVPFPPKTQTHLCPSVVHIGEDKRTTVGLVARDRQILEPKSTLWNFKRLMGRRFAEVNNGSLASYGYRTTSDSRSRAVMQLPQGNLIYPEQASAALLGRLRDLADKFLREEFDETVTGAIITVPAYFNEVQRCATRNAAEIAGLPVRRILNESTAAALAYGLRSRANETVLVVDLGGGTFDVSVLDVGDGIFEVKSTHGDSQLGGADFDDLLVGYAIVESQLPVQLGAEALMRVRLAAQVARERLTTEYSTNISVPFVWIDKHERFDLDVEVTRMCFESLASPLLKRIETVLEKALSAANVKAGSIRRVLLVGGASRMPCVHSLIERMVGSNHRFQPIHPDHAVAAGAAIQGAVMDGRLHECVLLDVLSHSIGVEMSQKFDSVIEANTTIPTKKTRRYTTSLPNQDSVDIHVGHDGNPMVTLGKFNLSNIPPMPAGKPEIDVTFDVDANGILVVTATEMATKTTQKVTLSDYGCLTPEEIRRMRPPEDP